MKNSALLLLMTVILATSISARDVPVSTGAELQNAMENALPGDVILIAPGDYTASRGSTSGEDARGMYFSKKSGTATAHITLRAQDMSRKPTIHGKDNSGTVIALYLKGTAVDSTTSNYVEYWDIEGITVVDGQKGVVFDACRRITMKNCSVSNIDQEGIHLRDNSSYITIDSVSLFSTGLVSAGYGEAFYIGTDKGSQGIPPASGEYRPFCNYNIIRHCTIGPGITAEHIDIKEGTIGNIFEYNTMNGAGISGANSANTFINDKAQGSVIRYNTGDKNGNANITAFGDISARGVYGSGSGGWWYYNTFEGASTTDFMVTQAEGKPSAFKWINTKDAGGNMYGATVTWTDKNPDSATAVLPQRRSVRAGSMQRQPRHQPTMSGTHRMVVRSSGASAHAVGVDGRVDGDTRHHRVLATVNGIHRASSALRQPAP